MPTEKEVYQSHADQYERLIQREDYQGNILREIEKVIALDGMDVVELGAGTGRLTRLLAPRVRSLKAFDASAHMLEVAETSLRAMGLSNWAAGVADHRKVPVDDSSADLVISGWSFCYWRFGVGRTGNLTYRPGWMKSTVSCGQAGRSSCWKRWGRAARLQPRRGIWADITPG